jgi:hypothetical protein
MPEVAPATMKPTAGDIKKPPIDVIIINENINALAVERRVLNLSGIRNLSLMDDLCSSAISVSTP